MLRHAAERARLGEAEVRQEGNALLSDENVGRLDVSMKHALPVGVVERAPDIAQHRDRLGNGCRTLLSQSRRKGGAVDELHDEVGLAELEACVVEGNDVRMVECGENTSGEKEARSGRKTRAPINRLMAGGTLSGHGEIWGQSYRGCA